ncbi:porin [Paraburkholderia silvatlantica]|nr:porin [Paraburkholderia silvatlantica]MBB2928096.1 putative porin [Paraburkholderia silvatlantica]PVY31061.1 putative porin [Paraburkholderia silvatlantica]PXW37197.1 putative porin [Paraburkholderia silvatlantica]
MKCHIVVLITLWGASTATFAQSSVTLYGVADDSITYTNNQSGHAAYQTFSGGLGGSKFGLLGHEDLGGGLAAVFRLESGFDMNSGKLGYNGRMFGRQSYMGLASDRYGTLTLGRQYDFMVTNLQSLTSAQLFGGSLTSHAGDVDGVWGTYPVSNTAKYVSPTFHGMSAGALYSFGGVPGAIGTSQQVGFGLNYARGPLHVGAAFLQVNNPAVARFDGAGGATPGAAFANPVASPIYSGYATARTMRTFGAGANYVLGTTTLGAVYTNTSFHNAVATASTAFAGSATIASYEAFVAHSFTPAIIGGITYDYTSGREAHYNQVGAGAQYVFSKRTFTYLVAAWQHASGTDSTGHAAVADLTYLTPSSTANQVAVRIGIRHNF